MRSHVQRRRGTRTFSKVSTVDSHIPSPCEVKDEPALKPLQGNPAFFQVRASRCPFHLRQQSQGPSHIPIAEGSLHFWCLCKVGLPLQSKPGNQLSSRDDMGCMEFSSICYAELRLPLDLGGCLRKSLEFPKLSQATCCVLWGMQDGSGANRVESGFISS